jgi:hypothetical protein
MRPAGRIKLLLATLEVAFLLCVPVLSQEPAKGSSAPQTTPAGQAGGGQNAAGLHQLRQHGNLSRCGGAVCRGQVTVPDITNHPWHITRKYGFGANLEQNLTPNVIAFARWGWDNGRTESFPYTEIDLTVEEGVGVNGAKWRRKQDRSSRTALRKITRFISLTAVMDF